MDSDCCGTGALVPVLAFVLGLLLVSFSWSKSSINREPVIFVMLLVGFIAPLPLPLLLLLLLLLFDLDEEDDEEDDVLVALLAVVVVDFSHGIGGKGGGCC